MNIQLKNRKSHKPVVVTIVILFIVAVIVAFLVWNQLRGSPFTKPNLNESNQQQSSDHTKTSENTQKNGTEENPVRDTPNSEKITAQLSIPSHQEDKSSILLNVAIDKPWPSTATCIINATGPTAVSKSEPVFTQAQISGCQFNISDLKPGNYIFTIFAKNGPEKTNTETVSITISQ